MRASADDARHLGEHEPGAAVRAAAEMHEVEVVGRAVGARVLRHRRHDDAVRQRDAAQRERREHRRHRLRRASRPPRPREPGLDPLDEARGRAAAGSRARCAGCASAGCRRTARPRMPCSGRRSRTTRSSCARRSGSSAPRRCARPRTPAARRRGRRCVAQRAARARSRPPARAWCPSRPRSARCARRRRSARPARAAVDRSQCTHVRHTTRGKRIQIAEPRRCVAFDISAVAVEIAREQPLAERDALLLRHRVEAGALPHLLGRLDDERRGVAVELVGVRLEPARARSPRTRT